LLDYAFCEVINSEVASTSNTPIQCEICINNTKDFVSGRENEHEIYKVGRTTNYTRRVVVDMLQSFFNRRFGDVKTLIIESPQKIFGKYLFSKDCLGLFPACFFLIILCIGASGDSGSPVFDKHNTLWGILQGISPDRSRVSVVPIHLILQHVRSEFGVSFKLI